MLTFINRLVLFFTFLFLFLPPIYAAKKIGVIVPLEHEAMKQIVSGIEKSLSTEDVEIIVKNAHSDSNILLAIIKQMKDSDIDLIMPIGTSASQMTISQISNKPIVCVAADIDKKNRDLITGINDEVPVTSFLAKLPMLQNITLIYSASEKVIPEVNAMKEYTKKLGISLHLAMIQTLNDLPSAVRTSPKNTEAFIILKDHLVVSGINILMQEAIKRSIPVIASDEGSVIQGATIAFGVKEKEIGVESGLIAKNILDGASPKTIPYQFIDSSTLFINTKSFAKQKILKKEDILALSLPSIDI